MPLERRETAHLRCPGKFPTSRLLARDAGPRWRIAIVDDQPEVHDVTRLALEEIAFSGRRLELLSAYSGRQARALLAEHPDVALVLVDGVMESDHAGRGPAVAIVNDDDHGTLQAARFFARLVGLARGAATGGARDVSSSRTQCRRIERA